MKQIVFTLALFYSATSLAEDMQVVFATGEWAPFTSETLPEYGAATALVTAVCKAVGIEPIYKFYPWPRAEIMVANGEAFAAFPYMASDDRAQTYDFSDVLFYGSNEFVYFVDNPKTPDAIPYETLEDLHGYRVGFIRGSYYGKQLELAEVSYEETTTGEQSIHKLRTGRIDFYLDIPTSSYDIIARIFPDQIDKFKTLPKPFGPLNPNVLIVSRTYPNAKDILTRFNEGLAIIKQNGEYDRIIKKYHMTKAE